MFAWILLERAVPKRIRLSDVVLALVLVTLAYLLHIRQERVARLQAALAEYQSQARIKLMEWLQEPNRVTWPEGATLADFIERIRRSAPSLPNGVPILVDPIGLEQAGKSMDSPVRALPPTADLNLQDKLTMALEPMGLAFEVKNASIVITSREGRERSGDDKGEPARESRP